MLPIILYIMQIEKRNHDRREWYDEHIITFWLNYLNEKF